MKLGLYTIILLLLAGCKAPPEPAEPVVDSNAALEFLQPGLRPEVLLFPEYLLMEEYELHQHGRIPESELVGAGMRTRLSLATVRKEYSDVLESKGWSISKMEIERQAFRLIANLKKETVEIRAVQARGPTEVFILFDPGMSEEQF